jgi:hypothetical protein
MHNAPTLLFGASRGNRYRKIGARFRIDFFQLVLRGGKMAFWELLHKPPYCSEHFLRDFISSGRHPLKIKAEGSRYETYVCRAGADAVTWTKDGTTHRI